MKNITTLLLISFYWFCALTVSYSQDELALSTRIFSDNLEHELFKANIERFSYVHPNTSEWNKNLYSQNIPLVLFATATRGNTQPLFLQDASLIPYRNSYVPTTNTRWYVSDRLFAVDNSAFFGIEFDLSFMYKNGVIRIGDSSEKAFVILVSLNPPKPSIKDVAVDFKGQTCLNTSF